MAMSSHITELFTRHKSLDTLIQKAQQHPVVDELEIRRLKREKLKIKDKIECLTNAIHKASIG